MEIGIYAAKTQLSALIDRVTDGEDVVITRHGRAVARIVPMGDETRTARPLGLLRGRIRIAPEFYEPMTPDELSGWEDGPLFPDPEEADSGSR